MGLFTRIGSFTKSQEGGVVTRTYRIGRSEQGVALKISVGWLGRQKIMYLWVAIFRKSKHASLRAYRETHYLSKYSRIRLETYMLRWHLSASRETGQTCKLHSCLTDSPVSVCSA